MKRSQFCVHLLIFLFNTLTFVFSFLNLINREDLKRLKVYGTFEFYKWSTCFLRDLFTLLRVNHVNAALIFIVSVVNVYNLYLIITSLTLFFHRELERRELPQYLSFVKNLRNPLRV